MAKRLALSACGPSSGRIYKCIKKNVSTKKNNKF